ncbi:MAG: hypothetical protein HYS81_02705 [Candidatus Aenigmatarchaeota archaeon]|nr:MAG: hypothetical protein HYS81_02705 [Candidatus Aenigmarchaeota archaeon]
MRPQKGISPIIAVVLLIGLTVASAAVLVNFYAPFQQARQSEIEQKGSTEAECAFASIEFTDDDVASNLTASTDTVNVTVDNTGSVDLYDFQITVTISNIAYSYEPDNVTKRTAAVPMKPGDKVVFVTNVTDNLSGTITSVEVVGRNCPRAARKKVDL